MERRIGVHTVTIAPRFTRAELARDTVVRGVGCIASLQGLVTLRRDEWLRATIVTLPDCI